MSADLLEAIKHLQAIHVTGVEALSTIRRLQAIRLQELDALRDLEKTVIATIGLQCVSLSMPPQAAVELESKDQHPQAAMRSHRPLLRKRRNGRAK